MRATVFHAGRHLAEADLLEPVDRCPLCLSTVPRAAVHRIQAEPRVDLLACPRCRGASASRMPLPDVLDGYYRDYYAGKDDRVTTPDPGRFAAAIVRRLGPAPPRSQARVLDFGGGDGSIGLAVAELLLRRRRGATTVDVVVVDYEAPAAAPAPQIRVEGRPDLDGVRGPFDVVLASAVLEHVPDAHPLLLRLVELVGPGGSFYARTPWLAPFRRMPGGLDLTYPAHVHDLGGGFWNRVVETFGLDAELVRSGPAPVEADARQHPARAGAAALLKLPARAEARLRRPRPRDPWWPFVGGWEAMLRRR